MAKVNEVSAAIAAMQPDWAKIDALLGGTKAMRTARELYLPKFPAEDQESYDYRVKTSTLFNGLGRTLENMAAKPFAEAITFTELDPVAAEWLEDIDQCGNNMTVFAHSVFTEGLAKGMTHILVDYPVTLDEKGNQLYPTKAAEDAAGVRPYFVHIKPNQIIDAVPIKGKGGAQVIGQVRFMECVAEPAAEGEFGSKSIEQIRVLEPGRWATYRKGRDTQKDTWVLHKEGVTTLDFVPMVTFYTKRTGFMTATPPLNDLADLNIKHWQSSSDQDSILHTARVPLLAISGLQDDDRVEIGAKSYLRLPIGAEAKYVEHTGAAITAGRESLQDLENQMRAMGAELLAETQVSTTATQNNIENTEQQCQLSRMVQGLEDTLDTALGMAHDMKKMEYKGSIDIFDDFSSDAVLSTAGPFVLALIQLVNNSLISKEDAFNEMQRYGILNPDLVWEDVQAKIEMEPPTFDVSMPGAKPPAPSPASAAE